METSSLQVHFAWCLFHEVAGTSKLRVRRRGNHQRHPQLEDRCYQKSERSEKGFEEDGTVHFILCRGWVPCNLSSRVILLDRSLIKGRLQVIPCRWCQTLTGRCRSSAGDFNGQSWRLNIDAPWHFIIRMITCRNEDIKHAWSCRLALVTGMPIGRPATGRPATKLRLRPH